MGYLLQMAGYTLVIVALTIGGVAIATQTSPGLALVFFAIGIPAIFLGRHITGKAPSDGSFDDPNDPDTPAER